MAPTLATMLLLASTPVVAILGCGGHGWQKRGDFQWKLSLRLALPNVSVVAAKENGLALLGSHASEVDAEGVQEEKVMFFSCA